MTRIFRMMKYYFLLFVRKEDSPKKIAHGYAIGIFVGYLPIIPFQALVSIIICSIFKANKLAGVLGSTTITNAIMAIPVFYVQHFLGRIFILHDFSYDNFKILFTQLNMSNINSAGKEILVMFEMVTIGGLIVGVISYPIVYYLTLKYIIKRRKKLASLKTKKSLK